MTNPYDPQQDWRYAQPGSAPPMHPAPPGYYGPPASQGQKQSTNGFAIASMVLGIVWIYWIGSILALVFGYIARKQIDESNGREGGRSMAVAGIVLGWVGIGVLALIIVLVVLVNVFGRDTTSCVNGVC